MSFLRADRPGGVRPREPFRVTNSSGATASAGEVGYIDSAGAYRTTTTANYASTSGPLCYVVGGGADGATIYVARRGRFPLKYTGTDPSAGDLLVTSTTGGLGQQSTVWRPEIYAQCLGAGSGGTVDALLLLTREYVPGSSTADIMTISSHSGTSFISTINGVPAGAALVYGAVTGNENSIKPAAGTELAKLVLHNTTRGDSALIDSVDTGTNTITLTAAVPGSWANGDAIQVNSLTNTDTSSSAYFFDLDLTSADNTVIPASTVSLNMTLTWIEAASSLNSFFHPYVTGSGSKRQNITSVAGVGIRGMADVPLIDRKFTLLSQASGANTATIQARLVGITLATP